MRWLQEDKVTKQSMAAQWLGHADTSMMAVYGRAVGLEPREIASKLWEED